MRQDNVELPVNRDGHIPPHEPVGLHVSLFQVSREDPCHSHVLIKRHVNDEIHTTVIATSSDSSWQGLPSRIRLSAREIRGTPGCGISRWFVCHQSGQIAFCSGDPGHEVTFDKAGGNPDVGAVEKCIEIDLRSLRVFPM